VKDDMDRLFTGLREKDRVRASKLMTLLEDGGPESEAALRRLYDLPGKALVIGVTGWPGAGKSTLIGKMAKKSLESGKRVGIVAVDPTSPLSGGGLLGDRIRFRDIEGKEGLFIRSMASRGHQGGLSRSARAFVKVLEVMEYDVVILETVGVGQDQITVSLVADTTVVVVAPGLGDYLQAIKAGILEVADIFVVNKADRDDADRTVLDLLNAISLREKTTWSPPVLKTVASDGTGVAELMQEIERHAAYSATEEYLGAGKARAARKEIQEALKSRLFDWFVRSAAFDDDALAGYAAEIRTRRIDPYIIADTLLSKKGIG
jgi:LAO/AO transport system kinase